MSKGTKPTPNGWLAYSLAFPSDADASAVVDVMDRALRGIAAEKGVDILSSSKEAPESAAADCGVPAGNFEFFEFDDSDDEFDRDLTAALAAIRAEEVSRT